MTDEPLNDDQSARVAALRVAREVLANIIGRGAIDSYDLIDVAAWLLDGRGPLDDYREATPALTERVETLESTVHRCEQADPYPTDVPEPSDLLYQAWGVIANANKGNWGGESEDWQGAARRWRDAYHAYLDKQRPKPTDDLENYDDEFLPFTRDHDCADPDCAHPNVDPLMQIREQAGQMAEYMELAGRRARQVADKLIDQLAHHREHDDKLTRIWQEAHSTGPGALHRIANILDEGKP